MMICERCQKKNVAVIHRSTRGGRMQARYVCTACSEILEATGELSDISAALPPYTASMIREDGGCFPFFLPLRGRGETSLSVIGQNLESSAPTVSDTVCPLCGMSESELIAEGRAGCPQCYTAFAPVIRESAEILHGKMPHAGRLPAAVRQRLALERRLADLRKALQSALAEEAYERAVSLRDEIRALESDGIAACGT